MALDLATRLHNGFPMSLLQDLQVGWRSLVRTPGFFVIAVLSLTLGIGANTAMFSLLEATLLRALPVKNPQQLVILGDPNSAGVGVGVTTGERELFSYPEFQDLKQMKSLSGVFATQSGLPRTECSINAGEREELLPRMVSGSFFSTLGVQPALGRFFDESVDEHKGQASYAVLSDDFWAARFGRDRDVLGQTVRIHQAVFTIIGVAPPGFFGESVGSRPDVWVPLSMQTFIDPGRDWLHPLPDPTLKVEWLHIFGRLQPGFTLAAAQTEANVIFRRNLEESYASLSGHVKKEFMDQRISLQRAATGASEMRDQAQKPLFIISAAVAAVLLICCVNVTNLLLARANSRRREVMVRLALGANKNRVIRQLLTESLILSVLGACGGVFAAQAGAELLVRMVSTPQDPIRLDVRPDLTVLLFTAAVALVTTLLFGLAPALRAARTDISTTLREGAGSVTASARRMRLSKAFVITQVALSLVLVVGAGLFLQTLSNLRAVQLGYYRDHILTIRVDGLSSGRQGRQLINLFDQLRSAIEAAPGVKRTTYSENGFLSGTDSADEVEVEGYTPKSKRDSSSRWDEVAPDYFNTMGIPILLGREITARDQPGAPLAAVINESLAKKFFPGRNPIGKRIADVYADKRATFEIVGVAANTRDHRLRGDVPPRFYAALRQATPEIPESVYFEVRTAADPRTEMASLRRLIQKLEPNVAIMAMRSVDDLIDDRTSSDRLIAKMTSTFGVIAMLLAAAGIYGVLAYAVSQRTKEIGIRMAIGAEAGTVVGMVLKETGVMLLMGVTGGLALSIFVTRLVSSQLVGVKAMDPQVVLVAIAIIACLGLLAGYGPAWRAARIDPVRALRDE